MMRKITLIFLMQMALVSFSQEGFSDKGAKFKGGNVKETNAFSSVTTVLEDFFYPSLDWGDYNRDGQVDLLISGGLDTTGDKSADISAIKLYKNTDGVLTEVAIPNIYGLHLGAVKFVDIDNDQDLDIVVTGQNYTNITTHFFTIYENDNGNFTEKQQLNGLIYSSISPGDYDNDGDLDLLVTGIGSDVAITKIFSNEEGSFTATNIELHGVQNGTAEFADVDVDGDLDIIVMGQDEDYNYILKTYKNTNASYTELESLPGMYLGWLSVADYDNDGDPDFAIMGDDTDDNYAAALYINNAGQYTVSSNALVGVDNSSGTNPIAWGDFDNDGDLDLVMAGSDENYDDLVFLYENEQGSLNRLNDTGITDVGGNTSLGWADYDGDNDLDFIVSGFYTDADSDYVAGTFLHRNNTTTVNIKPEAPTNLAAVTNADDSVTFSWDSSTDDHTPSNGLHYLLTVGTSEEGAEIACYKVYGTTWTIKNIGNTNFYWSVQAIDTSFVLSDKASPTLTIDGAEDFLTNAITLYPNPTSDAIGIMNTHKFPLKSLSIYDIQGKKIAFLQELKDGATIDVSWLLSGIYYIQMDINNTIITKKLVVY